MGEHPKPKGMTRKGSVLNTEAIINIFFLIVIIWIVLSIWGQDALHSLGSAFSAIAEGLVGRAKELTSGILKGISGG